MNFIARSPNSASLAPFATILPALAWLPATAPMGLMAGEADEEFAGALSNPSSPDLRDPP